MIFPKKPQILYAPMLATFGGGSANGFRSSGASELYDFSAGLHLVPREAVVRAGYEHRFGMYNFSDYRPDLHLPNGSSYTAPYLTPGATTAIAGQSTYNYIHWDNNPKMIWWTAPYTGTYNFICRGAAGSRPYNYNSNWLGGAGANLEGTFDATMGDIFYICVGMHLPNVASGISHHTHGHGGGGASFIARGTATVDTPNLIENYNADNVSGATQAPVVVAGGGGGAAGYSYVSDSYDASGTNASIEVGLGGSYGNNGYWSNYGATGTYGHTRQDKHNMIVNTVAGGGGLGGASTQQSNLISAPWYNVKRFFEANPITGSGGGGSSFNNASDYNGCAGGGGWLITGASGNNSTVGGTYLYSNASGGNAGYVTGEGGFGGGGGARNTSGGGGGGYIGGSGGVWSSLGWSTYSGMGNDAYGGMGGTSYVNYNFVDYNSVTASLGTTSHLAENFGRVQIWPT